MTRILTPDQLLMLPDRKTQELYWWSVLLYDLPGSDIPSLLASAAHSSQALERGSSLALAKRICSFLLADPHHDQFNVHYYKTEKQIRRTKVRIENTNQFVITLCQNIRRLAATNQIHITRFIGIDAYWAREFLAFSVAITLTQINAPAGLTPQCLIVAEYPFLTALNYNHRIARVFGKSRQTIISAHAHALLCQFKYRQILNNTIQDVVISAPDGRAKHWAIAASTVVEPVHPVTVAELLNFENGINGMIRAKVLISKVGRRIHDKYFEALCSAEMMTPQLAEFMAIEFRMPVDIVRAGLSIAEINNSHAEAYAIKRTIASGNLINKFLGAK